MANTKSSIRKSIRDMSFREQLVSLARDPRFKELVGDIRQLSPARQDALEDSLGAMEAEAIPLNSKYPAHGVAAWPLSSKKVQKMGGISE